MRLPSKQAPDLDWPSGTLDDWQQLTEKAKRLSSSVIQGGDAAEEMALAIRNAVTRPGRKLPANCFETRLGARTLTWLWCHDPEVRKRTCTLKSLKALIEGQRPRFTRITFSQLAQLYFTRFDQLEEQDAGLQKAIEATLQHQAQQIPIQESLPGYPEAIEMIQQNPTRLVGNEAPKQLAVWARETGRDLDVAIREMGLAAYDQGRFADVCRACYYLDRLQSVPEGDWDPVFDELLKSTVKHAPYEGDKRIGHAALGIIIDRSGVEATEAWQKFVINMAGDPRISSRAKAFREWWQPLGQARVDKVKGWLSREDLTLFLKAVEQYGKETRNLELQRMFPARRRFLEGLYELKLIRETRLMLGNRALGIVRRILGDDVKTSFATLEGQLADKAIIYLDCGDFFLVEGSHTFKMWIYLAKPGTVLPSYDYQRFTHSDLTHTTPKQYKHENPNLPYTAIPHMGNWRAKALNFLADNGVSLDLESLMTSSEYQDHLQRHGVPVTKNKGHRSNPLKQPSMEHPEPRYVGRSDSAETPKQKNQWELRMMALTERELEMLRCLRRNPADKTKHIANMLGIPLKDLSHALNTSLKPFVEKIDSFRYQALPEVERTLDSMSDS